MSSELKEGILLAIDAICEEYKDSVVYKRRKADGQIVKFYSLNRAEVVVRGNEDIDPATISHEDPQWESIAYNKELDLFHTQAVECWDSEDTHVRSYRFYNAIDNRTFDYGGRRDGFRYTNCKAIPLDEVPEWMNKARETL